MRDEREIENV